MKIKSLAVAFAIGLSTLGLAACGDSTPSDEKSARKEVDTVAKNRAPVYIPKNQTEYNNYNNAQKLYDSPSTIIWCTTAFANPSSPMVTVPIQGKLTSSSTTFFRPENVINNDSNGSGVSVTARSVDGTYHPNPPKYRYGFTPGGQYWDFSDVSTICTTSLTKFQRQKTEVSVEVDSAGESAQSKAEAILKQGTKKNGEISAAARKQAQAVLTGSGVEGKQR